MTVAEYLNTLNYLTWYATEDVSTKERKRDRFLGGPNHTVRCQLCTLDFPEFQTLVNKALIGERENKSRYDDRKHRYEYKKDPRDATAQKQRPLQPPPTAPAAKPSWDNPRRTPSTKTSFMGSVPYP
jgi:hypothetical protein